MQWSGDVAELSPVLTYHLKEQCFQQTFPHDFPLITLSPSPTLPMFNSSKMYVSHEKVSHK